VASKIKVDTLETADGTGSIALSNQLSGMTVASLPTTGTLPALDGSALTNLPAGDDNTPSFRAKLDRSAWGIGSGSWALMPFESAEWEVGSGGTWTAVTNGDTQDAKYTINASGVGKWVIHANTYFNASLDDGEYAEMVIKKNGVDYEPSRVIQYSPLNNGEVVVATTVIMTLAVNDYLQSYLYHNEGGGVLQVPSSMSFGGFRLAGV
jgi:hypothetical protein